MIHPHPKHANVVQIKLKKLLPPLVTPLLDKGAKLI